MSRPDHQHWITLNQFAQLMDIPTRTARYSLRQCLAGRTWRDNQFDVRVIHGSGGRSGLSYQVRVDSLPVSLRSKWRDEHCAEIEPERAIVPAGHGDPSQTGYAARASCPVATPSEHEWRLEVIRPVVVHPARSKLRAAAIAAVAGSTYTAPNGRRRRVSERTIRNWLAAYAAHGIAGLARKSPNNKGRRRTLISRRWDRSAPFDQPTRDGIAEKLRRKVCSLWAAGVPSCPEVQRLAAAELVHLTRAAGLDASDSDVFMLCAVPRGFVERERRYSIVAVHDKDAKLFFDKNVPRIRRVRDAMLPMEIVVGDVHHVDVLMSREDGSPFTPKIIAWHDLATNRLFVTVEFLPKGKGIRQEHVIASFIAMTQDPQWGVPGMLYLDNGGEYNWAKFVEYAMRLKRLTAADLAMGYLEHPPEDKNAVEARRRSMVIRARPYNAPAKPIEGLFGVLERGPLSMLPGWIGGDRMTKKTHNVGREPKPFQGTQEEFRKTLRTGIEYYHTSPQSGHLDGKSPRDALRAAVQAGWGRDDIDAGALEAAFAREELRTVRKGAIMVGGETYEHDALLSLTGERVRVRIPLVGDRSRLAILDDAGKVICMAKPAPWFPFLDVAGAREQSRRRGALQRRVSDLRRNTDPVDLSDEMAGATALHPEAPAIESAGVIRLSEEHEAVAAARRDLPPPDAAPATNDQAALWRAYRKRRAVQKG